MKNTSHRILIIDDEEANRSLLKLILEDQYVVDTLSTGYEAVKAIGKDFLPDLVLLDVFMPGLSGLEVCSILQSNPVTKEIPIILITGSDNIENELNGLNCGAVDFIHKPFNKKLLLARIKSHLLTGEEKITLEKEVHDRTRELLLSQVLLIDSMGILAEYRDPETGSHIKRTQSYVNALAKELSSDPDSGINLTSEEIELLYLSAPLHDIGKIGVPDRILNKPGKLTPEEFVIMKEHTTLGYKMLDKTMEKTPNKTFLRFAKEIAYTHHEWWDGSGYPRGLKGKDIPLSGRLMALADVYDALANKRCYKEAMELTEARDIIISESGSHFDPTLVKAFIKIEPVFRNIFNAYRNADSDKPEELCDNCSIQNVLIVDDNEINLEIMRNQLEFIGFKVTPTNNGDSALKALETSSFDVVLTDIDMPEMNGYELCSTIKQRTESTPVIAVTASDYKINEDNMQDFGFDGYLLKPFDDKMLLSILKNIDRS